MKTCIIIAMLPETFGRSHSEVAVIKTIFMLFVAVVTNLVSYAALIVGETGPIIPGLSWGCEPDGVEGSPSAKDKRGKATKRGSSRKEE